MAMNFGDLFDHLDQQLNPDTPIIIEEGKAGTLRRITAEQLKTSTNNLARRMLAMGGQPGDKVAMYARNRVEYLVATIAALKARLVHVNVNYRYKEGELRYLLDNSDAKFIVFESEFAATLDLVRGDLPSAEYFIEICDGGSPCDWAIAYDELAAGGDGAPLSIVRSPDDLFFLYTGGTTGMPKGVMWEHAVLWQMIGRDMLNPLAPVPKTPEEIQVPGAGGVLKNLVMMPFMHGSGVWSAINSLGYGNPVVIMRTESFDPDLALQNIGKHKIMSFMIAGDAFARPLIDALDANPGKYRLDSLKVVNSSAMIFSPHNKKALLAHCPQLVIHDNVGSSESSASAIAVVDKSTDLGSSAVVMKLTPNARVFTEDLREVKPGSGEKGFLAVSGNIPLGYYKDEKKTAETFLTIDGVRYSRPGDWVEVLADGSIKFLGRGNVSINTGGEKVYPEEVEAALKSHPAVGDCLIVGVPDKRFGQAIAAVVQLCDGAGGDEAALQEHVRQQLSGYKVPRHVIYTEKLFRAANGKADYQATKAFAEEQLATL